MSAYEDQDQVLSRRLRELARLAGAGRMQDVRTPGAPGEQGPRPGVHTTVRAGAAPVAAHEQSGPGTGPEQPDLPSGPHAPETPHAPDAPDMPESPELPPHEAPEAPDLPGLPGVPEVPEVDGPAEMPQIPDAPDVLRSPEIPPTPDIPPPPPLPDMPDIPEAPEIPESPGIYDEPEIPEPPRIDDPELPELDRPVELPDPPEYLPGVTGDPSAPDAPDVPRPPDLPDPPHPAPGGPDAVLDAVAAMHANNSTHEMPSPDAPRPFPRQQQPGQPHGSPHPAPAANGGATDRQWTDGAAVPPPAAGGAGGNGAIGGGPRGTGGGGSGGDGGHGPVGGGEGGHDGDDSELEATLRRMLQQSVHHIEPSPDALQHLRHAVPARRAHRRRTLVGAAAAVVLVGVGFPGLVGSGLIPGLHGDSSIDASDSNDRAHTTDGAGGAGHTQGSGSGTGGAGADGGKSAGADGSASPSPTQGSGSAGDDPNDTLATSAPSCGRQQLGNGSVKTESPDSDGKVYGSFRVVNTSSEACTVEGEGVVGAAARGEADIDRINVLDHTSGDAATALPDPGLAASALVLKPGQAYEVKWAWVPSECNTPKPPEPKAEEGTGPQGSQGGNSGNSGGPEDPASGGDQGSAGGGPGGGGDPGGKASVVVSHTPDVGDPAAVNTELEGACAGTLYRTGILAAD